MASDLQEQAFAEIGYYRFKPAHDKFYRAMVKDYQFSTCLNCINWNERGPNGPECLKWKMLPPPQVVVFSCGEGWEGDIPF